MKIHTLDLQFLGIDKSIAVFVVEGPEGLALVECGPASTLPHLQQMLAENGWKMADFQHVFLSHIHFDHAGRLGHLPNRAQKSTSTQKVCPIWRNLKNCTIPPA
jgi:glyoxylase-like metal-dependent hydrolase (beta-lactamase superfamily II)